jgi:hypothetical protein
MAWSDVELDRLEFMRGFYLEWIKDIEEGNEERLTQRREYGVPVDDRDDTFERYRRNVAEIEAILKFHQKQM